MKNANIATSPIGLDFIGWKAYNQIRKKATEKEFSWSGLLLSLSIAFFIVLFSAYILNIFYQSIEGDRSHEEFLNNKVYYLEDVRHQNLQIRSDFSRYNNFIYTA